uniref:Ig-like domain-containing protein n=1 Tax=Chelydra serpentina TaxID=8475 RepID=A0A8C3XMP9_CHESE
MELHQGRIWPLVHISLMGNGQNLSIQCPYNTQYFKEKKAWCRSTVQNDCEVLVNTEHGFLRYQNKAQEGRARIHDDTQKGIVTITMENLQVHDAGVYWCAHYRPPNLYRIIEVELAVTKGEYLLVGKMWGVGFLFCKFQHFISSKTFCFHFEILLFLNCFKNRIKGHLKPKNVLFGRKREFIFRNMSIKH